jgi:hypothetical protein
VVYGSGLENRRIRKGTVGSNPTLSAVGLTVSYLGRCQSGRSGLPAKQLYAQAYRRFESCPSRTLEIAFTREENRHVIEM